ncbi:MAG: hypothetical protein LW875_07890 [Proteobacteria bacterium]|jgi:7,8-dihydro-6-hydroxymethylpterin-pyrophosphokinase|nr:hypothetical protein [Pseudomonadota bacterium]
MNHFLVSVSIDLLGGMQDAQYFARSLGAIAQIQKVSSIYKRFLNSRHEDLNSELVFVVKAESELNSDQLNSKFSELRKSARAGRHRSFKILCMNDMIQLKPDLALPHPDLIHDHLILHCCCEVWEDYVHPVTGQKLNEILLLSESLESAEFFTQGKGLMGASR